MKLTLALLLISSLVGISQTTVTNIDVKVTTTVIVTGTSTNSSNSTLSLAAATPKDLARINGLSWAYFVQRAGGFTNSFDNWIAKTWIKDNADATAAAYNRVNTATTLSKLTDLLTIDIDLLSSSDLNNLNTIAAKAPVAP